MKKNIFLMPVVIAIFISVIPVIIPALSFAGSPAAPASAQYETPGRFLYNSYSTSLNDIKSYPSFFIKKSDRNYLIGFAAALGGGLLIDRGAKLYALKRQSGTATNIANVVHPFGDLYYMAPAVALLSVYGYSSENKKLTNASLTSIESLIFSGIIAEGLKIGVGRERPNATDNPFNFEPFNMSNTYKSFPSGDATVAWSMITPFAVYYNAPYLYALPVAVDLERVYKNKHWVSDTVMGSFIGFSIGYFFSKNHIAKNLSVGTDGSDITLNIRF